MEATFEAGKQGYIDINQSAIQKLSDADFPRFMGWQKIAEGNTPFTDDVLCDLDKLKKIVRYVDERDDPMARLRPGFEREDGLAIYIRENPEVLAELRGFVCHAPSEWDASLNDVRYRRLNDPDGFYGRRKETDPDGYDRLIRFLTQLQFLDKTPLGTGKKFWFFHPLAFIRHFRRCGWLADSEMKNTAPATALRRAGFRWVSERVRLVSEVIGLFGAELNKAMRKFGIQTPLRQAAFLGNAMQETQWFLHLEEDGGEGQRYSPWFGRGFLQLTWPDNYIQYWRFLGRDIDQAVVNRLRAAADKAHRERNNAALMAAEKHLPPEIGEWRRWVAGRPVDAADSAGAYWAWSKAAVSICRRQVSMTRRRCPLGRPGRSSRRGWRLMRGQNPIIKFNMIFILISMLCELLFGNIAMAEISHESSAKNNDSNVRVIGPCRFRTADLFGGRLATRKDKVGAYFLPWVTSYESDAVRGCSCFARRTFALCGKCPVLRSAICGDYRAGQAAYPKKF